MFKTIIDSSTKGFDTVVESIDLMMRDQIREVRATMEKDRNTWSTDVDGAWLFAQVRGIASKWCIDTLFETYERVLQGNFPVECNDTWWNIVYGIPCPHQIHQFILARTPIPPTDIHEFWKQLAWRPEGQDEADDCTPIDPIHLTLHEFFRRYNEGDLDRDTLHSMATAFTDAVDPSSTSMRAPPTGERTRTSRRGPCQTNPLQSERRRAQFQRQQSSRGRGRGPRGTAQAARVSASQFHFGHNVIDEFMRVYISGVMSVTGDGHCGFRSLALLAGRDSDAYADMRLLIAQEIITHRQLYEHLFYGTPLDTIIQRINCIVRPAPEESWLEMPLAGLAYATMMQVPLVCLSWINPVLCLPLYANQGSQLQDLPLYGISNAGSDTHFVPVSHISSLQLYQFFTILPHPLIHSRL